MLPKVVKEIIKFQFKVFTILQLKLHSDIEIYSKFEQLGPDVNRLGLLFIYLQPPLQLMFFSIKLFWK